MSELVLVVGITDDLIRRIGRKKHKQQVANAMKLPGISAITEITSGLTGPDVTHKFIVRGNTAEALKQACDSFEPVQEFITIPSKVFQKFKENKDKLLNEIRTSTSATIDPEPVNGSTRPLRVSGLMGNVHRAGLRIAAEVTRLESLNPPVLPKLSAKVQNSENSNLPSTSRVSGLTGIDPSGLTARIPVLKQTVSSNTNALQQNFLPRHITRTIPEQIQQTLPVVSARKNPLTTLVVPIPFDFIQLIGASKHNYNLTVTRKLPFISTITRRPCSNEKDPMRTYIICGKDSDVLKPARECFELVQEAISVPVSSFSHFFGLLNTIQTLSGAVIKAKPESMALVVLHVVGTKANVAVAMARIKIELSRVNCDGAPITHLASTSGGHGLAISKSPRTSQNDLAVPVRAVSGPNKQLPVAKPNEQEKGCASSAQINQPSSVVKPTPKPIFTLLVQVPQDLMKRLGGQQKRVSAARKLPDISSIKSIPSVAGTVVQGYMIQGSSLDALNRARDEIKVFEELVRIPAKQYSKFVEKNDKLLKEIQSSTRVVISKEQESIGIWLLRVVGLVESIDSALSQIATELSHLEIAGPPLVASVSNSATATFGKECILCLDALATTAFIPCGHKNCCEKCAEKVFKQVKPCPYCRAVISQVQRIYD